MSSGELYGVQSPGHFYKGSPPTQAVSSDKCLNSSTLIGKSGWNEFKFLISPVKIRVKMIQWNPDFTIVDLTIFPV